MRIFNQLRKLQIQKGRFKDYSLYALGEIVLIVIGILVALQLNTWTEDANSTQNELLMLEKMKQAFESNSVEIENANADFLALLETTEIRMKQTGPNIEVVESDVIEKIRMIDIVELELSNQVENINLSFYQDQKRLNRNLQQKIFQYIAIYEKYKTAEENHTAIALKLRANHQKYASLLQEAVMSGQENIGHGNFFKSDYLGWVTDRDHQNLAVEAKWKIENALSHLETLQAMNRQIIDSIDESMVLINKT